MPLKFKGENIDIVISDHHLIGIFTSLKFHCAIFSNGFANIFLVLKKNIFEENNIGFDCFVVGSYLTFKNFSVKSLGKFNSFRKHSHGPAQIGTRGFEQLKTHLIFFDEFDLDFANVLSSGLSQS